MKAFAPNLSMVSSDDAPVARSLLRLSVHILTSRLFFRTSLQPGLEPCPPVY
jgi:hypothetical protein